jgi:hypothetical protein
MSLRANLIANYLGQGWTAVMGLAFVPMYIHYLGMEAYGLIGLFAVMQAWMSLLVATCKHPRPDLQTSRFSARISCK